MILLPSEIAPLDPEGDDERRSFDYKEFAALVGTRGTKNERLRTSLSKNQAAFTLERPVFSGALFGKKFS
jgi:hypothetical protein